MLPSKRRVARDGALRLAPFELKPAKPRFAHRLLRPVVTAISQLPPRVLLALAGDDGPLVRDGEPLAPELQLLLSVENRRGVQTFSSPADLRRQQSVAAALGGGRPVDVGKSTDLVVDGAAGPIRARHYAPHLAPGAPLLVYLHGGGFVFGDLDTHDAACRLLCRHGGMHVLAIDYRLAPENPFPAALDDARRALRWARVHALELGADPSCIGIGGDSAGANLSAVVAQLDAAEGEALALQLLLYPAVDRSRSYPSLELFADGFFLTLASIKWFHDSYVGASGTPPHDPRIGPLHAESLAGLAPALVVTAGFDPLRDEGEAYAAALSAAGTPTVLRRFGSLVHGFINMVGLSRTSREAVIEVAGAARALLATAPTLRAARRA